MKSPISVHRCCNKFRAWCVSRYNLLLCLEMHYVCIPFNIVFGWKCSLNAIKNVMGWLTRWRRLSASYTTPAHYLNYLYLVGLGFVFRQTEFISSFDFDCRHIIRYIACAAAAIAAASAYIASTAVLLCFIVSIHFKRDCFAFYYRCVCLCFALQIWIKSRYRWKCF